MNTIRELTPREIDAVSAGGWWDTVKEVAGEVGDALIQLGEWLGGESDDGDSGGDGACECNNDCTVNINLT